MTVKELIKALQAMPEDTEVLTREWMDLTWGQIATVYISEGEQHAYPEYKQVVIIE